MSAANGATSSGEFASTDPITRTQDTRFQERRIGTSFLSNNCLFWSRSAGNSCLEDPAQTTYVCAAVHRCLPLHFEILSLTIYLL